MEHRGIKYTVVQGIGRHMWTWTTSVAAGVMVMGKAHSKAAAVTAAEKAIDRALTFKKVRLVPHEGNDQKWPFPTRLAPS
jgi:hypothetical protein